MKKILIIIGVFSVLSASIFISGCGDEDEFTMCKCHYHYSGTGSENHEYHVKVIEYEAYTNCESKGSNTTDASGLTTVIACTHN